MAYSDKIKDKKYTQLRIWLTVKKFFWFIVWTGAFAAAVFTSKHCPTVLAAIFTAVFAVWMFIHLEIPEVFEPTWDGVVENVYTKTVYGIKFYPSGLHGGAMIRAIVAVRRDSNNRLYKRGITDKFPNPRVMQYKVGERVRHHALIPLFEKENKEEDREVVCWKCKRFVNRFEERCWHCGLPVLTDVTEYIKVTHSLDE